jgi:hypothetical protein
MRSCRDLYSQNRVFVALLFTGFAFSPAFSAEKSETEITSAVLDAELGKFLTAEVPNFKADAAVGGKAFEYPEGVKNDEEYREHMQKFFRSLIQVKPSQEALFKAGKFDDANALHRGKVYVATIEKLKLDHPFAKRLVAKFNAGTAKGAELEVLVRFLHGLSNK